MERPRPEAEEAAAAAAAAPFDEPPDDEPGRLVPGSRTPDGGAAPPAPPPATETATEAPADPTTSSSPSSGPPAGPPPAAAAAGGPTQGAHWRRARRRSSAEANEMAGAAIRAAVAEATAEAAYDVRSVLDCPPSPPLRGGGSADAATDAAAATDGDGFPTEEGAGAGGVGVGSEQRRRARAAGPSNRIGTGAFPQDEEDGRGGGWRPFGDAGGAAFASPPEEGGAATAALPAAAAAEEGGDLFGADPFAGPGPGPGPAPRADEEALPSDEEDDEDEEPYREDDAELGAGLLPPPSPPCTDEADAAAGSEEEGGGAGGGGLGGGESRAERIERYNARGDGASSSSSDDDDEDESSEEGDDDADDAEDEADVQFQAMEDDGGGASDDDNDDGHVGVRFGPTEEEEDDGAPTTAAIPQFSVPSAPPPPPPPPPPPRAAANVPLIRPPPEDKMKAWAASKGLLDEPSAAAAAAPTVSGTPSAPPSNVAAVEAVERAVAAMDIEPKYEANEATDEASGKANQPLAESDAASVHTAEPANVEQIRAHVPVTTKVPVEKETAEDRARLAAKFASASSAAAQVFEKRYERSPRGSSENLIAHAGTPPSMNGNIDEGAAKDVKASSVGFFCGSENTIACVGGDDADVINEKNSDPRPPGAFEVADLDPKTSSLDEGYQRGVSLHGGAFNSWAKDYGDPSKSDEDEVKAAILLTWVRSIVVGSKVSIDSSSVTGDVGEEEAAQDLLDLLGSRTFFNKLCYRCVKTVNEGCLANSDSIAGYEILADGNRQAQVVELAKFLERIALATDTSVPPPFDQGSSAFAVPNNSDDKAVQELILDQSLQELIFRDDGSKKAVALASFLYQACRASEKLKHRPLPVTPQKAPSPDVDPGTTPADTVKRRNARGSPVKSALKPTSLAPTTLFGAQNKNLIVSKRYPSPFETSVWNSPKIVPKFLSFLGDPAAVCRMKAVNRDCHRIISDNEHVIMKTAVRLGGLEMHLRPSFWMWITLEKCRAGGSNPNAATEVGGDGDALDLQSLSTMGEEGRWHHTIMRDVTRSFGNMPPHKSGQKLRKDSIVRALVFYGQGRLIKRGVKGGVDNYPRDVAKIRQGATSKSGLTDREHAQGTDDDSITSDQSPTDTVSDWGAVSPVGSTVSLSNSKVDGDTSLLNDSRMSAGPGPISQNPSMQESSVASIEVEDIALCPRDLTNEVKEDLQSKLGFILHALATSNDTVGYCQGMDYIVAHLLRILQETVLYRAVKGTLPPVIKSKLRKSRSPSPSSSSSRPPSPARSTVSAQGTVVSALDIDESSLVVEETVYRVMHTMLTTYGLQHFYWPELRCLKTCCKVFERLVEIKLPVLADHFDHHGLNVGIFALGWFQTLFLYLPSMPTATVCHMWDIWLVERSFKIFFRVGTAILFLSQPILLNHELEGMMTYLNTMPDATLLNPDILLACANQIKVTNRMLEDIEAEVTGQKLRSASAKVETAGADRQSKWH